MPSNYTSAAIREPDPPADPGHFTTLGSTALRLREDSTPAA
jgi:hypothetical protein